MHKYEVKKDGYTLGVSVGKHKAIARIKKELADIGHTDVAHWGEVAGNVFCTVKLGGYSTAYTVERANNA